MKRLVANIETCAGCPWGVKSVPPDFEPKFHGDGSLCTDYLERSSGLFCRSKMEWIGGEDGKYDGPIPEFCPLPEGAVQ